MTGGIISLIGMIFGMIGVYIAVYYVGFYTVRGLWKLYSKHFSSDKSIKLVIFATWLLFVGLAMATSNILIISSSFTVFAFTIPGYYILNRGVKYLMNYYGWSQRHAVFVVCSALAAIMSPGMITQLMTYGGA